MRRITFLLVCILVFSACSTPTTLTVVPTTPSPVPASPTGAPMLATPIPPSPTLAAAPTATFTPPNPATPTIQATSPGMELPEEAILILSPGPGSRVTSPILVSGMADTTFEQALGVRLLADDGSILAEVPTTIQAEMGKRGPFEVEVPFNVSSDRQAFLQVFSSSPRDGGVTHLSSVGIQISPTGTASIVAVEPHPEQIAIHLPAVSSTVSGGVAHVEGFGLASFEHTLLIEVYDMEGNVVGSQAVIVNSSDLGEPGPFTADIPYSTSTSGPGRIAVRDISPAFGKDTHLASVEINLSP